MIIGGHVWVLLTDLDFVHGSWHGGKRGDLRPAGSWSRAPEGRTHCRVVVDGRRVDHGECSLNPLGRKGSRPRAGLRLGPPNSSNSRPLTGHRLVLWRHPVLNAAGVPVRCGLRLSQGRADAGLIARPGYRGDEQAMARGAHRSRILRRREDQGLAATRWHARTISRAGIMACRARGGLPWPR
jgi:hypothetical protein